ASPRVSPDKMLNGDAICSILRQFLRLILRAAARQHNAPAHTPAGIVLTKASRHQHAPLPKVDLAERLFSNT
ncbi:MAG: hypothetical protein KGL02_10860, partial [Acidobacteriota bacterium]|nr:hypothetical protein [Acidobacteriota bacterium]